MSDFVSGTVLINHNVVDTMIAMTAYNVEGVLEVKGFDGDSEQLRYGYDRFLQTITEEGALSTSLILVIDRGVNILEVVQKVQDNIRRTVEMMMGLKCARVDVKVE